MDAGQLAVLREVVGKGPSDDALLSALRRSRGDLAAAANIILDAPVPARPMATFALKATAGTITLDDDGEEVVSKPAVESTTSTTSSTTTTGTTTATAGSFLKMMKVKQEEPERPKKRPRVSAVKSEMSGLKSKRSCNVEWALNLGALEVVAYSTMKLEGGASFPGEDGTMGPLLRSGGRLELKWAVETKKGRPGVGSGKETGQVHFEVNSKTVGKFPSWTSKALVPLLARKLIDAEAVVGKEPPRALDLGTNIPVLVYISLRSSALRTPGQLQNLEGGKAKGQKAVQKAEDDREVQRKATSILLEKLQLRRPRKAVLDDVPEGAPEKNGGSGASGTGNGGNGDGEEEAEEVEMSTAAAAQLGRQDHLERHDLPGILLPKGVFETTLRSYQAQAVYWMWQRENPTSSLPAHFKKSNQESFESGEPSPVTALQTSERQLHPMWDEYELPEATGPLPSSSGRESARFLYYHRTTGALSLDFPDAALAHCRGGILADEMGLGKTVMCLALMSLDLGDLPTARSAAPELRALEEAEPSKTKALFQSDDGVAGVLVVAPLSLIRQWQTEAQKHFTTSACPNIYEFHGSGRKVTAEELRNYGIVMTTYNTLASQNDDSPLFQLYWRRIILDEAHAIKNRCSRQAQAAFQLRGFCRWCVTGTPLQNSVEELFSAIRFLRVEPWCAWASWRQSVSIPLDKGRQGDSTAMAQALDTARRIVTPLIIRRTKKTVDPVTGEALLQLPAKHVHVHKLQLSLAERDFYETLWTKAKTQFDTFVAAGEVLSKYTHILQLILKLRQALCHPFMVFARESSKDEDLQNLEKRYLLGTGGDQVSETFANQLWDEIKNGQLSDCAICCDAPQDATMTPCGHIFCRECCYQIIQKFKGECPICRRPGITKKSLTVLPGASRFPAQLMAKAGGQDQQSHYSTKMKELMQLLKVDMADGHRAVVYSQFTSFMDLIGSALDTEGIEHKRFDGSLTLDQRAACVAWLQEETPGRSGARVLLVSLKAGGTGLNLVAASRLYLMDLWWNPAVEEQAIQRVHRIGQKQEVHIYKFVVEDSIDIDLLELHRAKERLLEDALRGGGHSETAGKLTMDDLKRLFNPCRSSLRNLKNGSSEVKAETTLPDVAMADSGPPVPAPSPRELVAETEIVEEQPLVASWDAAEGLLDSTLAHHRNAVQDSDVVMAEAQELTQTPSPDGCPKTQPQLVAAWEAAGDLLEGPTSSFGFGEEDISDSELLAACHAAETLVQSMEGEHELGFI